MINRTGMTIDLYLKNVGIKSPSPIQESSKSLLKNEPESASSFKNLLQAVQFTDEPVSGSCRQKVTIKDYLRSYSNTSTMPASFYRSTLHGNLFVDPVKSNHSNSFRTSTDKQPCQKESDLEMMRGSASPSAEEGVALHIKQSICDAAKKYNISKKLIQSVIQAESNFQVDAVSPAGAQGLMQLMPSTARELGVTDPLDINQNIDAGTRYLRKMLDRFNGDIKIALSAYNAGPGTVERYDGNVPFKETQNYVQRVLSNMKGFKNPIG